MAIPLAPVVAMCVFALPFAYAAGDFSDKQKVKDIEFPVGFGQSFIPPQNSGNGYLFFPRGSYAALEVKATVTVRLFHNPEDITLRCPW
jgi:hypothetical protein